MKVGDIIRYKSSRNSGIILELHYPDGLFGTPWATVMWERGISPPMSMKGFVLYNESR